VVAFRRALELQEALVAGFPRILEYRRVLGWTCGELGDALSKTGQLEEAARFARRAVDLLETIQAESPSSLQTPLVLANSSDALGVLCRKLNRPLDAERAFRREIEIREALLAKIPTAPGFRRLLRSAHLALGDLMRDTGRPAEAERAYRRVRQLLERPAAGDVTEFLNEAAWFLATSADPQFRDPRRAVGLAREGVERAPKTAALWNTLGVAEYRAGAWDEAIRALSRSVDLASGGDANDWLFLAMAHWRKGDKDNARAWFDKAITWMDRHDSREDELNRFRAEAEALIRRDHPDARMPNGPSAFAR
jgi:tetratricopeptide (TPR) repeat protein